MTCERSLNLISEGIHDNIPPPPPPQKNFEYGYPHSNVLLQFRLKLERC